MSFPSGSDSDGSDSAVSSRSPPRYKNLLDTVKSLRRMGEDTRPKKKRKETESYTTTLKTLGILAGDSPRHRDIMLNHGALSPLLSLLQPEFSVFKGATWCLSKFFSGKPFVNLDQVRLALPVLQQQIRFLANQGCIKPFCELLAKPNPTLLILCLEGLENILKVGRADQEKGRSEVNNFAKSVNKCGGIYDKIHNLMLYENEDIRDRASKLFKRIWAEKEFPDLDS
ncbi:hypothetical protein VNO80_04625 [Phaseolus coccineus]|uniref:Uncharacterized protein n=1 Tax=Phaseolus coccineus TaxID=3886 RepID=A0AAN9RPG8_PHACN